MMCCVGGEGAGSRGQTFHRGCLCGSISGAVASLSQVASSSQVARSSLPQPEVHVQCTLDTMEWLVQVLIDGGVWKVAERELVSSAGRSQQGNGTLPLMDYDQEWV